MLVGTPPAAPDESVDFPVSGPPLESLAEDHLTAVSLPDAASVPRPLAASDYGIWQAVDAPATSADDAFAPLPSVAAELPSGMFQALADAARAATSTSSTGPGAAEKVSATPQTGGAVAAGGDAGGAIDGFASLGSVVPRQPIGPLSKTIRIEPIPPRLGPTAEVSPAGAVQMNVAERMAMGSAAAPAAAAVAADVADDASDAPRRRRQGWAWLKLALHIGAYVVAAWLALILSLMVLYRFVDPPMSSLMLQQRLSGGEVRQRWVQLDQVSPQIVRAVIASEDGLFCQHAGVDFDAMQEAIDDGAVRGASTISMQVVKNLFLWPSKSYLRKASEIPLTLLMELLWPKRRIMEIYLNIAEWGPGIFGVEEASRFHFNKPASRLNEREAAQLAVALPNPYLRDAGSPGPKTRKLARDIQIRMRNAFRGQTSCVLDTRR